MKTMRMILCLTILFSALNSEGQILKKADGLFKKKVEKVGLSQEDAGNGIKEALIKGISTGVKNVSQVDGYFGNPEIKIPFPEDAKKVETKLRSLGMGQKVDDAVLSINRAAEDAGMEAKPIFIDAIKGLSFQDAIKIVNGDEEAATDYLRGSTMDKLKVAFRPKIEASLEKVDATRLWEDVITSYNKIPLVKKVNPDLAEYVTDKAIIGLFIMIAKEEKLIRQDPGARTTDLLKKVFGS